MKNTNNLSLITSFTRLVLLAVTLGFSGQYAGGFSKPVWDSSALWAKTAVRTGGSGAAGFWLDGPAFETMMGGDVDLSATFYSAPEDGPYGFFMRDTGLNDRSHLITGSSVRGFTDGPFDCARFASWHYLAHRAMARSAQYIYFTEPENRVAGVNAFRRLDLVNQQVTTLASPTPVSAGSINTMFADSAGNVYMQNMYGSNITILNTDGSTRVIQLQNSGEQIKNLALDAKNGRLYAGTFFSIAWYVIYWDLSDGSWHGVLPYDTSNMRSRNEAGSFDGANLYREIYVGFGPDDPDKRFLYLMPNDTHLMFRLDLENRWMWSISEESDGVRFISTGVPNKLDGWSTMWCENGDIGSIEIMFRKFLSYKRVQ